MLDDIYSNTKTNMQKCTASLLREFSTLRSSRVNISVLDNVRVDYYGSNMPINQVANIVVQDANTITITPWEKSIVKNIEKAILEANLGVNPNSDGDIIRLFFPAMTTEQRKEIAKQARAMGEKAKVAIRNVRQDANNAIKKLEKDKLVSSDNSKKGIDEIQKITDLNIKTVDSMVKDKEEEILKI